MSAGVAAGNDGSLAAGTDIAGDISIGDVVTYQGADAATSTDRSLALTSATVNGVIDPSTVSTSGDTFKVYADGSSTTANDLGTINYVTGAKLDLTVTATYKVNGSEKPLATFEAALGSIANGSLKGSIKIGQSGTKVVYELTTSLS